MPETGPQFSFPFDNQAVSIERGPRQNPEIVMAPKISDNEFYARLIDAEGNDAYFCPKCGRTQGSPIQCAAECEPKAPSVFPLTHDNFIKHSLIIRSAHRELENV